MPGWVCLTRKKDALGIQAGYKLQSVEAFYFTSGALGALGQKG
jgi:hypothetical protein